MRSGRSASCRRWAAAAPCLPIGGQAGKGIGAAIVSARSRVAGPTGIAAAAYHGLSGARPAMAMSGPRRWRQVPAIGLGVVPTRGAKVKSKMRLEDLPQGPVEPPPAATSSTKAATPKRRRKGSKGKEEAAEAEAEGKEESTEQHQQKEKEKENEEEEEEEPAYPTVVLQARRNMRRFDNCVLLTRVGGFYELYFEHAEEYGPPLNLKVTSKKTSAGPVAMAGFPFFQLERFLKTLVLDMNCYVAVAEEFPNDPGDKVKSGGLMHDRRVTRIITPGTLIDENFIDPYANNYVMSIYLNTAGKEDEEATAAATTIAEDQIPEELADSVPVDAPLGLAWLDITTGQFYTQSTTLASLSSILSRVAPREIVVDEALESRKDHSLFSVLAEDRQLITFAPRGDHLPLAEWAPMLESKITAKEAKSFTADEEAAGSLLLQYVRNRLLGMSMRLQPPQRHENLAVMAIDKNSMRALEIKQTIRDGTFKGTLLHAVRRTVTKGGARLLSAWLAAPSTSLDAIRARQDLVAALLAHPDLRDEIVMLLRRCHDSQRLVQKFAFGRGDADDMIALANTITATQDIAGLLEAHGRDKGAANSEEATRFAPLLSRLSLEDPARLAQRIRASIDEEGLSLQHQTEDSEASELAVLAEDVVAREAASSSSSPSSTSPGDPASSSTILPQAITAAAAARRKRAASHPTSLREHYYADDDAAFTMKPEASSGLRALHTHLATLLRGKADLTESMRQRYDAPSLTLKWTPNLGHICHVRGKDAQNILAAAARAKELQQLQRHDDDDDADDDDDDGNGLIKNDDNLKSVSASRSTRALHAPAWTALGQQIHTTRFEIAAEERRLFADLRTRVVRCLVKLRRNAAALDELDVLASFARLAAEGDGSGGGGWVRPLLDDSAAHVVVGGRHPTVEASLREQGRSFTKNDCLVGSGSSGSGEEGAPATATGSGKIWLITGPNMAGKSTYLRQNALITILAQAGSWVPADHAAIGVVDAIWSRVGAAADSLHRDESTFMVEMLETAAILRGATRRSLVVMDEVGRGTTPRDGAAVAFAALHHLVHANRCRALFATHFHALADWARDRAMLVDQRRGGQVETWCTDVREDPDGRGGFAYVHRLRRGVNRQSHALKVARLAGLPEAAIAVAEEVLGEGEREGVNEDTSAALPDVHGREEDTQTRRKAAAGSDG